MKVVILNQKWWVLLGEVSEIESFECWVFFCWPQVNLKSSGWTTMMFGILKIWVGQQRVMVLSFAVTGRSTNFARRWIVIPWRNLTEWDTDLWKGMVPIEDQGFEPFPELFASEPQKKVALRDTKVSWPPYWIFVSGAVGEFVSTESSPHKPTFARSKANLHQRKHHYSPCYPLAVSSPQNNHLQSP